MPRQKKNTKKEVEDKKDDALEPEVKTEAEPKTESEAKPEVEPEAEQEVEQEVSPEVETEAKPEVEVKTESDEDGEEFEFESKVNMILPSGKRLYKGEKCLLAKAEVLAIIKDKRSNEGENFLKEL